MTWTKIAAGEPLMRQAMDGLYRYNESKGRAASEVVERLPLSPVGGMPPQVDERPVSCILRK